MQAILLFEFDDTDIMNSSRDSYFEDSYVFSDGLMFAFSLTAYDSEREPIEDPSIGTLKAYYKTWGLQGDKGVTWKPIPTRKCTNEDFHINEYNPNSPFYSVHKSSQGDLQYY